MQKKPRVNKSKAEILAGMKESADFQRKMKFVKESFYPTLCEASTSIDDATLLLSGFNTQMMQEFLARMKETKMKDLNLISKLEVTADKYLEYQKLLALFDEMSVFEAKDIIEGLRGEIDLFKAEEFKDRPLASLKVTWVEDYLAQK